jgi:KDO2-lipid IV(A) lauroyltransferase
MTSFLFKMIFRLLTNLPLSWLHCLGALLGRIIFTTSKPYAARTEENLRQSHLATDEAHYATLLKQTVAEAGKSIIELPWVWGRPLEKICAAVRRCQGWDHVEAAHARGKGIVFLTPHWGCFEMTSLYIGDRKSVV